MLVQLKNCQIVDPLHPNNGVKHEIWIEDSRIVNAPTDGRAADAVHDMQGSMALAGGIDLHTHIGGGKTNLARLLMQEYTHKRSAMDRGPLWSTIVTGQKYLKMGYTLCFEPAMLLSQARFTQLQLRDTPWIDSGAYVVMGNEDWLLRSIGSRTHLDKIKNVVAWTLRASCAYAIKVVNAGGINAFRFNKRMLDIDEPHPEYGATPRDIIKTLSAVVDELRLPHPLHVHASNLGVPGNIRSTLATLDAAEGRRLHLTHAQFNAYTDTGPFGMGSGAVELAERINRSPELSLDVGQIIFGQTVTISADTQAQFRNSRYAKPVKSIISDVECMGGCGVVPMRYENKQYVSSLQWIIGLELMLLIKNPYQVFLTTDHPNGGPFTSYPHLIRLLMDRSYRANMLATLHPAALEQTLLKDLTREYTLDEIAILTRAAPAKILGLQDRGSLSPGNIADIVFYEQRDDWEATFSNARSVWKRGTCVLQGDRWLSEATTETLRATPLTDDLSLAPYWKEAIEQTLRLPCHALSIGEDEFAEFNHRTSSSALQEALG